MNLFEETPFVEIANAAYDEGSPIITDQEFDILANNGLELDSRNFRKKVNHPFPMGSLDKIKNAEDLSRWLPTSTCFTAMPKLDGLSIRLSYIGGELVQATTRGDGVIGNDVTANILCTNVTKKLATPETLEVRIEVVISKFHAHRFDKNLRNVAAGMIGAKQSRPELALLDCIVIDVIRDKRDSWWDKMTLFDLFPTQLVVPCISIDPVADAFALTDLFDWAKDQKERWDNMLPYAQDGLVLQVYPSDTTTLPIQEGLIPKDKIALKFGSVEAKSSVQSIEWNLGQHGKLTPVLNIAPVEIDGTTVSRVTASNYSLLKKAGLGIGAQVSVCKSGDIIPFVQNIEKTSDKGLEAPDCPACGHPSGMNATGVDAICINDQCEGKVQVMLQKTVNLFEIDFISDATINSLFDAGYDTLEKLFTLCVSDVAKLAGFAEKSAQYLVDSLQKIELSEAKIIKCAFLKGIGERKGKALLNHYGSLDNLVSSVRANGLDDIEGFGPIQGQLINENINLIADQLIRFRNLGVEIVPHQPVGDTSVQEIVCCTGTCTKYGRKELALVLEQRGYLMVNTVTKDTTLLLCAGSSGKSSKLAKARKQGIPIQSYDEFFA